MGSWIGRRGDKAEMVGSDDGGDEEAEENEGGDGGEFHLLEFWAVLLRHDLLDSTEDGAKVTASSSHQL